MVATITVRGIIDRLNNLHPHPWVRDASVSSDDYHVLRGQVPPYRVTIKGWWDDQVAPQTAASIYREVGLI